MPDDILLRSFEAHISYMQKITSFIETLYYDRDFATVFNRPALSMLATGARFVRDNLIQMKDKYVSTLDS